MSVDFLEAKQSLSVFSRVLRYRMSNSPELDHYGLVVARFRFGYR